MRTPAFHRMSKRVRWVVTAPVARVVSSARRLWGDSTANANGWHLAWANDDETRWRRGAEILECYAFDDGFLTTVEHDDQETTWQLTSGPVSLGSALAAAALYLQYDLSPQFDRDGRPFVGVSEGEPIQVFEASTAARVRYVFLDGIRTLEEFPPFLDDDTDVTRAFKRMSPERRPTLSSE